MGGSVRLQADIFAIDWRPEGRRYIGLRQSRTLRYNQIWKRKA
jgi:hypothetical protein